MMVAERTLPVMPGKESEAAAEPEVYHALFEKRKMTKADALERLKSLEDRKLRQVAQSADPETVRNAQVSAEACSNLRRRLGGMKESDLEGKPMDVSMELAALIDEGREKQQALLNS
jgi:hypothetical protein